MFPVPVVIQHSLLRAFDIHINWIWKIDLIKHNTLNAIDSLSILFNYLPGTPTTVEFGGTSDTTTLPAPIFEFFPIVIDPKTLAPD